MEAVTRQEVFLSAAAGKTSASDLPEPITREEIYLKAIAENGGSGGGGGEGGAVTVDSSLSATSKNPVQNKTITQALNNKQEKLTPGSNISISENNEISTSLGSATITVAENTGSVYKLKITNPDGSSFTTPNLVGGSSGSGTIYHLYQNASYLSYLDNVYIRRTASTDNYSLQDIIDAGSTGIIGSSGEIIPANWSALGWAENYRIISLTPITVKDDFDITMTYTAGESDATGEKIYLVPSTLIDTTLTGAALAEAVNIAVESGVQVTEITSPTVYTTVPITQSYAASGITSKITFYIVVLGSRDNENLHLYELNVDDR